MRRPATRETFMAEKKKNPPKKAEKKSVDIKDDAAQASGVKADVAGILTGESLELEATAPEQPEQALALSTDEMFEAEYGKVIRDRDQTGLLTSILKELFLLRTSRG